MIDWKISPTDARVVMKLVARAASLLNLESIGSDRMSLAMDLTACHQQLPLKLAELLEADDFNFLHDVCGIMRHINRADGKLTDCFLPRFVA